jgi:hypothetical protein
MVEKVKLSKDGLSIDFVQSETLPNSVKKFKQSPEIEGFYRFIFENDLRKEALEILERLIAERKAKKQLERIQQKTAKGGRLSKSDQELLSGVQKENSNRPAKSGRQSKPQPKMAKTSATLPETTSTKENLKNLVGKKALQSQKSAASTKVVLEAGSLKKARPEPNKVRGKNAQKMLKKSVKSVKTSAAKPIKTSAPTKKVKKGKK